MVKKRYTFKNLEEILKNLVEILKTWKKLRKPGENFQKSFGHPVKVTLYHPFGHPVPKVKS